jgi:hypothetical protein
VATIAWGEIEHAPPPSPPWRLVASGLAVIATAGGVYYLLARPAPPDAVAERVRPTAVAKPTVAQIEASPVPAPPRVHIASASPEADLLTVNENASQRFAVTLADAGKGTPDIRWTFDGKPVPAAAGQKEWTYAPAYDAAGGPYEVAVRVGDGDQADLVRQWRVSVQDVDRPPVVGRADPSPGTALKGEVGSTVPAQVSASDADGDDLRYVWTVDGKAIGGNEPRVAVPIRDGSKELALAISDGKSDALELKWPIEPTVGPLALQPLPAAVPKLRFGEKKTFSLKESKPVPGLQVAWAVDDAKRSDAKSFAFVADDVDQVGKAVTITATARDALGRTFNYTWKVAIEPPPPPRLQPVPAQPTVDGTVGTAQPFRIDVAGGAGKDIAPPTFTVDGQPQSTSGSTLSFAPPSPGTYRVVASIKDRFGQTATQSWTLRAKEPPLPQQTAAPSGSTVTNVDEAVRAWLAELKAAFNQKNVDGVMRLLRLSPDRRSGIEQAMALQNSVEFSDVKIQPLGNDQAQVTYTRQDDVSMGGRTVTKRATVKQTLSVQNGRAELAH